MRAGFALLFLVGCNITQTGELGNLVFDDNESLEAPGNGAFVVGDELSLFAFVADGATSFPGEVVALSSNETVMQFDGTPNFNLSFRGTVVGEGEADLEIVDATTLELIDQISLRGSALASISIGKPGLFDTDTISESFSALHMLPGDAVTLLAKAVSSTGEQLKGQLAGSLATSDETIATIDSPNVTIGGVFTLNAPAIGVADITLTTDTSIQSFTINVVSPDDVTITTTIPELGTEPISQGSLLVDSVLPDGNNLDTESYIVEEICVDGSATTPCLLTISEGFLGLSDFFFEANRNGRAAIGIALVNSDGEPLKTEIIEVDVIAQ